MRGRRQGASTWKSVRGLGVALSQCEGPMGCVPCLLFATYRLCEANGRSLDILIFLAQIQA
jgi:hypothetical protein